MAYINVWAILVSGISAMVIGSIWYSPILFGNKFMKLMGITPEMQANFPKSEMVRTYTMMFFSAIFSALILNILITGGYGLTTQGAVKLAIAIWAGFIATTHLGGVLWDKKPWALFFINAGNALVTIVVTALILVCWN